MVDQLLRSTASVSNNIVEGNAHQSTREFIRFLGYSVTSAWEAEGQLQQAVDLGMIRAVEYARLQTQVIDVRRMLYGLIKKLKDKPPNDDGSKPPDKS